MKKQTENKQSEKQESSEKSQSSQFPFSATVKDSKAQEKIRAINIGESLNVAHVSNTKASCINVLSATTNSPNRAPLITSSPVTQPSSSVSHTNVDEDISVSSHIENNQPAATASGNTVSGDLNMKVIGKYEKHIHQSPSPEEKRIVLQQYLEDALQQLRSYRLKDEAVQAELATYVPVQGGQSFEDTELFDVATKVKEFLSSEKKILLLLGDSGMGKSVFGQTLEKELWESYKKANQPIPLFIPLPSLEDPIKHAVDGHLLQLGFKSQQITQLKQNHSFIIILDGYDEIAHHKPDNLYVSNQLSSWNAKVIISCRSQYLLAKKEMYRNRFLPDYKGQPEPGLFLEIVLKPFTQEQIETYLKKFVEVEKPIWRDWQVYQKYIEAIPDLKNMIETPFLLRITVEVLPDIAKRYEDKKENQRIAMTRANLYEAFVQRWFERQEYRLKKQGVLTDPDWDIKSDFWEFSKDLAIQMFQKGVNEVILETKAARRYGKSPTQSSASDWDKFFSNDGDLPLIRSGCPLKKIGENRYTFIHKSLLEYFGARQVFDQVAVLQSSQLKAKPKKETSEKIALPSTTLLGLDINQKLLNDEPSMILFLADLVKQNEEVKQLLFALIDQSKTQAEVKIAAANAMTILKVAKVRFSGMDFSRVKIPGADLNGGVFDHTNFSWGDLRGVNLDQAWLRGTNASYSNLRGVQLGQRPYLKHKDGVSAIAYTRDGCYLAVASGCNIILWDRAAGKEVRTLSGHTEDVRSVAFSPNGEMVASGSSDWTVRLWEVKSGQVRTLNGHIGSVYSVAFSPNGEMVASGSWDDTVGLWEVKSGQVRILNGHTDNVCSVAFSPNGEMVASGSSDKTVRLWEVKSGQVRTLSGHTGAVRSVVFSPNGQTVASGSEDKTVGLWEVKSSQVRVLSGHTNWVTSVSFSPDGQMVASGSSDKTVRLWDVKSGQSRTLSGHTDGVNSVNFSPDGQTIASGSSDKSVRLWEIKSGQARTLGAGHTEEVWSVVFSPDGQTVASGSEDKTVRLWEVKSGQSHALSGHTDAVRSVVFSPDGQMVASGSFDNTVRLWEMKSGQSRALSGHTERVDSVAFSPDGQMVTSGSFDNTVRLWGIKSGKARTLSGHAASVGSVAFSPDGQTVASGSSDNTVRLWEVKSGKARTLSGHTAYVWSVAFSPDGRTVASGSRDQTVRLWEVESGQARTLSGHAASVGSVAFSPDGQTIASGSSDKTVWLWEVKSGKCIAVLQGYLGSVTSVCFKAADTLVTGSGDGAVKLWRNVVTSKGKVWELQWSSHVSLYCEDMLIEGAQGLSEEQQKLLEQQGAKGTPNMQSTLEDDDNNKSTYSPMWQKPQKQEQAQEKSDEDEDEDEDKHSESFNKFP